MKRTLKQHPGMFTIFPVDSFYENGHFWSVTRKFEYNYIHQVGTPIEDAEVLFVNPILEVNDLGIQSLGQENPCMCAECLDGRKKVKEGWKPCLVEYLDERS